MRDGRKDNLKRLSALADQLPHLPVIFATLGINLVTIAVVILVGGKLPPELPLFFGLPDGELQIARRTLLVVPPLLVTAITIINILWAGRVGDNFLKKSLIFSSLLASIFSSVAVFKIIFLVGSF